MKLPVHTPAYAMAVLFGSSLFYGHNTYNKLEEATQRAVRAEAEARTAYGKLYDMQEAESEAVEAAHRTASMDIYNMQRLLDACTEKVKNARSK